MKGNINPVRYRKRNVTNERRKSLWLSLFRKLVCYFIFSLFTPMSLNFHIIVLTSGGNGDGDGNGKSINSDDSGNGGDNSSINSN